MVADDGDSLIRCADWLKGMRAPGTVEQGTLRGWGHDTNALDNFRHEL